MMTTSKSSTKVLVTSAILMALGTVLHTIIPSVGIKPDFMLACMFVSLILTNTNKEMAVIGIVAGIITAMTTGFPAGQIPNLVDKALTTIVFGIFLRALQKRGDLKFYHYGILFFLGTMFSGSVFLTVCLLMGRLLGLSEVIQIFQGGLIPMFVAVVFPTACANVVFGTLMVKIIQLMKKTRWKKTLKTIFK